MEATSSRFRHYFRSASVAMMVLGIQLAALAASGVPATAAEVAAPHDFVRAGDVLLPKALGTVKEIYEGRMGQAPIFLIGESHYDLGVQQAVAGLLRYLRDAYDVKSVFVEGLNGPLAVPPVEPSLLARRTAAEAELLARHIDGVSYFALAYPDVRVIGVEDMQAYEDHGKLLAESPPESQDWAHRFQEFLIQETSKQPSDRQQQILDALKLLKNGGRFEDFSAALSRILGRDSEGGHGLSALLEERARLAELAQKDARPRCIAQMQRSEPLMKKRNRAMASGVLKQSALSEPVVLVVGSLHLPGIIKELKAAGRPFVSVLLPGVAEDPCVDIDRPLSEEESKVISAWQGQAPTPFETWLVHHKPTSSLQRAKMQEKLSLLAALTEADLMVRSGSSLTAIQAYVAKANLPGEFRVLKTYPLPELPGGYGMDFQVWGKTGHVFFSSPPPSSPQLTADGPGKIESGMAGDRKYTLFDGDSGRRGPPPSGAPPGPPGPPGPGDFSRRVTLIIAEQEKKNEEAATVVFLVEHGILFRQVGTNRRRLGVTPDRARELINAYKAAPWGPERLSLAQQIAADLLVDIDHDLPPGKKVLYQISDQDLLGELSLAHIAALAREPGTSRLQEFEQIYTQPWENAQRDLTPLTRPPALVKLASTVVWMADSLVAASSSAETLAGFRAAGVRVNEVPTRAGQTLVLLGNGDTDWQVSLEGGARATSSSIELLNAVRTAGQVVSLGLNVPQAAAAKATQLALHDIPKGEVLSLARDLVEDIRKNDGKKSLDELLRKRTAEEWEKERDEMARRSEIEEASAAVKAAWEVDSKATILRSVT